MTDEVQHATFLAAFPAIQSAIKCGQDTWRIQLDIPASELDEAKKLLDWQGVVLMVTIVPVNLKSKNEQDGKPDREGRIPKGAKRKPGWTPAEITDVNDDLGASR